MKFYILGMGRAGKDYAAEFLRNKIGLQFKSSSYCAAEIFLFDLLKEEKGYQTIEECYADRHSPGMRERWYQEITKYNSSDPTRLSEEIFKTNDAYIGLRNKDELEAAKERWPEVVCLWVDASERVPAESSKSCTAEISQADFVVYNNGTIEEFERKLEKLAILLEPHIK